MKKNSGPRAERPELLRLIGDLKPGKTIVAGKIDRISRLPLPEAEKLVESIREKGAQKIVPGRNNLTELIPDSNGVTDIVTNQFKGFCLSSHYEGRGMISRQGKKGGG
ncbi:recombinase family protein [Vibrio sonorensis]|uniref:recombinase family protein n=1 Tax=Vibrio sonorensis TaxID=1004316 RepID=UPI001C30A862|nr:recombinase family protein [Vibrio sonorensis]